MITDVLCFQSRGQRHGRLGRWNPCARHIEVAWGAPCQFCYRWTNQSDGYLPNSGSSGWRISATGQVRNLDSCLHHQLLVEMQMSSPQIFLDSDAMLLYWRIHYYSRFLIMFCCYSIAVRISCGFLFVHFFSKWCLEWMLDYGRGAGARRSWSFPIWHF